ncbi:CCAAT-binding factor, subunit C (HAP5) [Tubulinosema ratisbonensis]|uniref:CCAAT-binding factor, subunit C (HAP5) n=1 Tax=Tubulinosema ratisbonensis TaxID=291195 RepID=A0A437AHB6_9MICR|nr:CCAAT-binding factor, subunit C (HAP5) [Tubulinosema ratisbonensis]
MDDKFRFNALEKYWMELEYNLSRDDYNFKDVKLPLARIKRLMKVEEGARMVASEVPILFSKVTEAFIEELTIRAWTNTDENKRRILQRSDISAAIKTSDMYDFLIYIAPKSQVETALGEMNKLSLQQMRNRYVGDAIERDIDDPIIPNNQNFMGSFPDEQDQQ